MSDNFFKLKKKKCRQLEVQSNIGWLASIATASHQPHVDVVWLVAPLYCRSSSSSLTKANLESNPLAKHPHNPNWPAMSFAKHENLVWFLSLFAGRYLASIIARKETRGVSHCGLAIYMKKYLISKEELWKLKYFTIPKYNHQKIL